MQARHNCADRDVQDLRRVGIGELADVDKHDHVTEIVRHLGERIDDRILAQALQHPLSSGFSSGDLRLELVVEEVVAGLGVERRGLRRALLAATAVDVQVRQNPEQPRTQVRAGRVLAPRAESPLIGLLDEILGLLARARRAGGRRGRPGRSTRVPPPRSGRDPSPPSRACGCRRLSVRSRSSGGHPSKRLTTSLRGFPAESSGS